MNSAAEGVVGTATARLLPVSQLSRAIPVVCPPPELASDQELAGGAAFNRRGASSRIARAKCKDRRDAPPESPGS